MVASVTLSLAGCGANFGVPVREGGTRTGDKSTLVHIVQKGDTLYSIAWDSGLDYRALARWNNISRPYVIHPGQRLRLRPGPGYDPPATAGATARKPAPSASSHSSTTARRQPEPVALESGPPRNGWGWPTRGSVISGFSPGKANPGIDIAGEAGQAVRAAADGRVVYSGDGLRGYGQLIIVKHNETYLSAYAHNRKLLVSEGERVRRGQQIAEMGSTGTDRVKLHFEIRKQGSAVNPLHYLPKS